MAAIGLESRRGLFAAATFVMLALLMRWQIPILFSLLVSLAAEAGPVSDYAALTRGVRGIPMSGTAGGVAVIGRLAFPLAVGKSGYLPVAAGYLGDQTTGGRMVAFAHTSLSDVSQFGRARFLLNVVNWAGRSDSPKLACGPRINAGHWQNAKVDAVSVTTPLAKNALVDVDVIMLSLHDQNVPGSIAILRDHLRKGKGLLVTGTPWAAKAEVVESVNTLLEEAGLAFHGQYTTEKSFPIHPRLPSPYFSALRSVEALAKRRQRLDAGSLALAARSVEQGLAHRPEALGLSAQVAELNAAFGWIQATKERPLEKAKKPVEAMLARYQANLFATLPADKMVAHPGAKDWPGGVEENAPTITRKILIRASAPSDVLVNSGRRGKRLNTGVYAPPGKVLTIRIPERAAGAGLVAQIGVHIDKTFHLKRWRRFPHVSREWTLNGRTTRVAGAFGGLVILGVPPGCSLGNVEIEVAGGVEAPAFVLGETTKEEWRRLRNAPGAWGYIESTDFCSYLARSVLRQLDDPEAVARYWQTVMSTADRYLGYGDWRRHGEGGYTDRDISAGYGHAGYPVVMAYGDGDALAKRGPREGDWGFLHEIGHTFQDSFDGNYTIATHAEVDVNLVPAMIKMLVHDVTCIDNRSHNTFDAKPRLAAVKLFQALPPAEQTWDRACKSPAAYDFYFTLAECFGWELYERAFGRLMGFLKYPDDEPDLKALNPRSQNHKRDRFFLLFCQESGHNLLPYFRKYGLAKGRFGLSPQVIAKVRAFPEWSGNRPLRLKGAPTRLGLPADAGAGAKLHRFAATDPDPGTIFTWSITKGNEDGAFHIHKRSGALEIKDLARARQAGKITVQVSDSTSDQSTASVTVAIQ